MEDGEGRNKKPSKRTKMGVTVKGPNKRK